jgi:MYXO-CTERM domain-containing protein
MTESVAHIILTVLVAFCVVGLWMLVWFAAIELWRRRRRGP